MLKRFEPGALLSLSALLVIFAGGCAGRPVPPGEGRSAAPAARTGADAEVVRRIIDADQEGRPREVAYYRAGRRLAVEFFAGSGERESVRGNIPDGPVREYYEDGRLRAEIEFRDGERDGPARYYFPDGTLQSEVNWSGGRLEGTARVYRPGGTLSFLETYHEGVLVRRRHYDPRGQLNYDQEYLPGGTP